MHSYNPWWQQLREKVDANIEATGELAKDISVPLNYYAVFDTLEKMIPRDAIIVSEGANTMVCFFSEVLIFLDFQKRNVVTPDLCTVNQ